MIVLLPSRLTDEAERAGPEAVLEANACPLNRAHTSEGYRNRLAHIHFKAVLHRSRLQW